MSAEKSMTRTVFDSVMSDSERREGLEARFWPKVSIGDDKGCWEWTAARHGQGYGRVALTVAGQQAVEKAHRVAYALTHGMLDEEAHVLHLCDNPPCCNPSHLMAGTPTENINQMFKRGRARPARGSRNGNSKLTENEVLAIKSDTRLAKEIAVEYGVSWGLIYHIRSNRIWSHINGDAPCPS